MDVLATLSSYLPSPLAARLLQDPDTSLLGESEWYSAAVLFADLAKFTPLVEAFSNAGRSGTEELTGLLNHYFTGLIEEIDQWGGVVGKFAGDALTVFFTGSGAPLQAAACAVSVLQKSAYLSEIKTSVGAFTLRMKLGLAYGDVLQTVVGNDWRCEFVFAGEPLDNSAQAEHRASPGEIILHPSILDILPSRQVELTPIDEGYAILSGVHGLVPPVSLPSRSITEPEFRQSQGREREDERGVETFRPFLPRQAYERVLLGHSAFVNEHRQVSVLFVNFEGIDYTSANAVGQLNDYLGRFFEIVARFDGYIRQVEMGDKGSKVIVLFGAPVAHENDEERALLCALALQELAAGHVEISTQRVGATSGLIFVGNVGAPHRQEYSAIGDTVNLSARLMTAAAPGQILVDEATYHATEDVFAWRILPPVLVKGKSRPVPVYELSGRVAQSSLGLLHARYTLPMVGRADELTELIEMLRQLKSTGHGCVVGITAEAGLGKSRLAAEVVQQALDLGFRGFSGNGASHGTTTPYLAWRPILNGLLGIDEGRPLIEQVDALGEQLQAIDSRLPDRLPLLGDVLGVAIPDNELTVVFDANLRRQSLFALFQDVICYRAKQAPLLLVLEDAHWLDDLSRELARAVAAGIADCPVFFLTIYRPPEVEGSAALWVSPPLHFAEIRLSPFSPEETRQLICLKLGERLLPPDLLDKIEALSQGNPFFVDEFINLLQERAVRLDDPAVLASLDVPDSVQTLIVSRLDQLAESEKMALRVASVIGQLFRTRWLLAIYPGELRDELLFRNLEHIRSLGMLYLDKPSPELEYLFKHAIMQEVVYGTLSFANRRMLHQRVTGYIENTYADDLGPWYGILAYHCQHSEQVDKEYTYVCLAGKQAARQSAHRQAAEFFGRAVNLFKVQGQSSPQDEFDLRLELCEQHSILGNHALLVENVTALMSLSQGLDPARRVEALLKRGGIERGDGSVEDARRYFQEAIDLTRQNRNALGLSKALFHMGGTYFDSSEYAKAKEILYKLVEEATPETWLQKARAQQILGWVCYDEGRFDETEQHWQSAHTAFVEHGHKPLQALVLTNLGALYATRGYIVKAIEFGRRGLTLAVQLGYRGGEQEAWRLLGDHYFLTGQFEQGWECFSHCVEISHQLGERTYGLAYSWARMAEILVEQAGDLDQALALAQQAYDLAHDPADLELGGWIRQARGRARLARGDTAGARADLEESLRMRKELGQADTVPLMLAYLGLLDLQVGDLDSARGRVNEMWAILFPIGRDGTECPEACWACYRILDVTGDSDRARQALQRGFAILQKMAGNMETEEIRRSYLEQITINRAVVEAYLAFSPSCCPHG